MTRLAAALLAIPFGLAACGEKARPLPPIGGTEPDIDAAPDEGLTPDRPAIEEVPEEERIAAIEVAMNALAPVANQCWAAAAADDFHLAGDVRALITIGPKSGAGATIEITENTTDDDQLTQCLSVVLGAYAWAPPLAGQSIELPFHFTAPTMQNVVDRQFVPHRAQAGVDVAVLLDETNTGNAALSMAEVQASTGSIGAREAERLELWTTSRSSSMRVKVAGGKVLEVGPADVLLVPKGARLAIEPSATPLDAVVAFVPGGREGTLRAGAVPGKPVTLGPLKKGEPQVSVIRLAAAKSYAGPGRVATILVEPPTAKGAVSLGVLAIDPGTKVPLHVHAKETEALYVIDGGGTMTIAGTAVPVTPTSVVQIPANTEHGFEATAGVLAIQLYTPAGPEQRFKKPPPTPPK